MINFQQTVIVGLGPSGKKFLEFFKQRLLDTYGDLPAIMLLSLDVPQPNEAVYGGAANEEQEEPILFPTEMIELPLDEIDTVEKAKANFRWLSNEVVALGDDTWQATRAAARVALHKNIRNIDSFLNYHLTQIGTMSVYQRMQDMGFNISAEVKSANMIIVGALGEPAASGMLLDVTYLVQQIFSRLIGGQAQVYTTGILFLPPAAPTDPYAESMTYAALKELDDANTRQQYVSPLPGIKPANYAPFNTGCFLIENGNERNIWLNTPEEMVRLSAEWLFRSLLSPIKKSVDDFVTRQGPQTRNQGRFSGYASFGLSTYVIPVKALIEYSANRLGDDLLMGEMLSSELFSKVSARLTDFYTKTYLRPGSLREKIGSTPDGQQIRNDPGIGHLISSLGSVALGELIDLYRRIEGTIEGSAESFGKQISINYNNMSRLFDESFNREITDILRQFPVGGLSLALQFVERMRAQFDDYAKEMERREAAILATQENQAKRLSVLDLLLKRVVAGIPPLGILIFAFVAGLLIPLGIAINWLFQAHGSGAIGLGTLLLLLVLVLAAFFGGGVYAYTFVSNAIEEVRNKCQAELTQRFRQQVDLLTVQYCRHLYTELSATTRRQASRLHEMQEKIQQASREFHSRLDEDSMCGEIGFALQRSVLTPDLIDQLYVTSLGKNGVSAWITPLIQEIGSLDRWFEKTPEDLVDEILVFGRKVFVGLNDLRVETLLLEQTGATNPNDPKARERMEFKARENHEMSSPLWRYDGTVLGQYQDSDVQTYVGLEKKESDVQSFYARVNPNTLFLEQGDPHSFVVTRVRNGIPLFALIRADQLRTNYLESVCAGGMPLHLDDEAALSRDLAGTGDDPGQEMDAGMVFAVGAAMGLVKIGEEGCYCIFNRKGTLLVKLCGQKLGSAVILGITPKVHAELIDEINDMIRVTGIPDAQAILKDYAKKTPIEDWERRRIEKFINLLLA